MMLLFMPVTSDMHLLVTQEYPVARGHVHITDSEDVSAPIDFIPGYLESSVPSSAPTR